MRARATLAAVAALLPVLAVASIAGVLVQRDQLTSSTTLVAREHAQAVADQFAEESSTGSESEGLGGEDLVQVIRDGEVVQASPGLEGAGPMVDAATADSMVSRGLV